MALERQWSGEDKQKTRKAGSGLCRKALWQWTFTRLDVVRNRPKTEVGTRLGERVDKYKLSGMPAQKRRSKVSAKAVEMLFAELLKRVR